MLWMAFNRRVWDDAGLDACVTCVTRIRKRCALREAIPYFAVLENCQPQFGVTS